ncbi:shikimate kinase [Rikenella microfusus]|uniref:shikimate kinase n=1 Tax=Rikenella microfusus TaxID=28139 RepID=UPI001D7369B7|nr:shikimate kinase [Rikenella microfusus]HJE89197.1 shikimate kinase [Rikenella microfusus]
MLIFLIGFMGSGKTTLGKPLAARLGYRFIDLDKAIEEGEGSTVGEIFAVRGEAHFRTLEHKYLQNIVSHGGDLVVSTGGGTPCFGGNMELMNASGVTVYFKLSPAMLADRLSAAKVCRPLLAGKSPEELLRYIVDTLAVREAYYGRANVVVANPSRDVAKLVAILGPYLSRS